MEDYMTEAKFYKSTKGYTTIECIGHTGYAESGKDIVCSAISSVINTTLVGLKKVLGVKVSVKQMEGAGYIRIDISNNMVGDTKVELLIATCFESIKMLARDYKEYIKWEVIDDEI